MAVVNASTNQKSASVGSGPGAAMTLDVYADLFESDLDAVADRLENVLKMCSRGASQHACSTRKRPLPAQTAPRVRLPRLPVR
jgi:hypothetical protein